MQRSLAIMKPRKQLSAQISVEMEPGNTSTLVGFLKCRECSELAQDAVETRCCHALLCSKCLTEKRDNSCPDCLAVCRHAPNHLARRLIGTQPWRCPGCGKESTRSEQADHSLVCPQTERACPAEGCSFRGVPDEFLVHLTAVHRRQVLKHVNRIFEQPGRRRRSSDESMDQGDPSEAIGRSSLRFYSSFVVERDPSRGDPQETNKNYCGRPLNGPRCDCCDGNCGPRNGCNCVDCMRLDLVTFGVGTEQRTLVNREGVVSRMSEETGRFYCGRQVMRHDPTTDGFCGPHNGNNCHACRKLDEQLHGRYAEIAAEWDLIELHSPVDDMGTYDY